MAFAELGLQESEWRAAQEFGDEYVIAACVVRAESGGKCGADAPDDFHVSFLRERMLPR